MSAVASSSTSLLYERSENYLSSAIHAMPPMCVILRIFRSDKNSRIGRNDFTIDQKIIYTEFIDDDA